MKVQTKSRILRFGAARLLTRAVTDGDFVEMNAHFRWDMPTE
ncbi:hypothetical protein [Brevundimonas variabilis]|uniref:Uncharacterized protein n=1 Tax=Brevundimonas variabilis TaxID=74312 RepID=A0A7W9CJG2_9CAUL|nr:hypothetical protein [Brevundimonas variabilis]MBB5746538.1 hypothetical protein [Brevundimonas variabilis]